MLLISSGSVETNPVPNPNSQNSLSFAMWNLDSLPARDYSRIPIPYRAKLCRAKVTNFSPGDENFARRIISPYGNFARPNLAR